MAGVHASRRDLDDPELVDARAARCVVYPGAGHMAWYAGGENGGVKGGERRRDSGVAAGIQADECDDNEAYTLGVYGRSHAQGARMPTETRFGRVGDDAFWAAIESLVLYA